MSGVRPTPAEHHLGDRLAALVDGELGHDARERVLAHLATCARCKAEADAQRRVKSFFAESAPPPPSEGLLARLQGLSEGAAQDGGRPFGGGGPGAGARRPGHGPGRSVRSGPGAGTSLARPGGFPHLPLGGHAPAARGGFRIHGTGREAERPAWRGRRFVFAAAGAVSFAAIALGGAIPTGGTVEARGEAPGSSVTPLRSPSAGQSAAPAEGARRTPAGAGAATGRFADRPAPLLPGAQVRTRYPAAVPFLHAAPPRVGTGVLPLVGAPDPLPVSYPSYRTPPATVNGAPAGLVESTVRGAGGALSGQ
ncbi:zf-HC2 domain-containing protein [Streptomyces sudanensis]|uniref:zf-HC2 domain-containing protein n=1 Tax=Streptomyces sudanensis TaxID=436397 RepID=UPI0020CF8D34|nr:zf-HC2 domain-containing protein [Streptomyces sudanensis]MCP9957456.1 zf-HC2 domain-containing protein [Streptomyces sudanensis]MCQ0001999.1 zf-HC2 domain-containing protein [Streptomyces sudanensis]